MLAGLWTALTSRIGRYLAAIGAALAILFAAYAKGRKDNAARATETRLNEINKARKVEHEVDGLDSGAVSERLGRWMRD
ncbi:hypothetical protein HNR59_002861 [Aquamicrobium lusatiense]|uniref:Uncharacterized protein n=1 Tax=Aquamicrobium lusatiense TaxID=89772 RepID=A0A7W9VWV5_9HYPH|nr:hypothetical protein [Aquamicrobium lusatiense]MBB6013472.1 hypothetical protein [Aquamicrobium lusatiense]